MPTYSYQCSKCDHEWDTVLKIAELDNPLSEPCVKCKEEGGVKKIIGLSSIGDPVALGVRKPDSTFKQAMERVKKHHPAGTYKD